MQTYQFSEKREQSYDLFGFVQLDTRKLFEQLLGVKNVGPKVALAVLDIGTAPAVRGARPTDSAAEAAASPLAKVRRETIGGRLSMSGSPSSAGVLPVSGDGLRNGAMQAGCQFVQTAVLRLKQIERSASASRGSRRPTLPNSSSTAAV